MSLLLTLYDTKQNSFTYHKNDHKDVRLFLIVIKSNQMMCVFTWSCASFDL